VTAFSVSLNIWAYAKLPSLIIVFAIIEFCRSKARKDITTRIATV
jgi:hypothetical protein